MSYQKYLESEDWQTKRLTKLSRKGWSKKRCAVCSSKEKLEVHHLNYRNLTDVEQTDLRVLCHRCHFLAHDLHREGKLIFRNKNHHSRFVLLKNAVKKELEITNTNLFNQK